MIDSKTILPAFSRRSVLGSIGASALLAGVPSLAFAKTILKTRVAFPSLTKVINGYVNEKKVAGMIAAIGVGQGEPTVAPMRWAAIIRLIWIRCGAFIRRPNR